MVCQSSKMVNYLDETVDCSKDKGGEDRGGVQKKIHFVYNQCLYFLSREMCSAIQHAAQVQKRLKPMELQPYRSSLKGLFCTWYRIKHFASKESSNHYNNLTR